jgi:hypothetical protein
MAAAGDGFAGELAPYYGGYGFYGGGPYYGGYDRPYRRYWW